MTQGVQIPIQTVANNTVTVSFKDAALTLKVTPQITAANTVIMQISVENATPDFSRQVNGIPPINTQRANTPGAGERRPDDGDRRHLRRAHEQTTTDRTPGLGNVPLLKWLFKRDTVERPEHRAADLHHAAHHQELRRHEDAMRTSFDCSRLAALVAATVSCGDVVRAGPLAGVPGHRLAAAASAAAATRRHARRPADLRRDHQRHVAGAVHADDAVPDGLQRHRLGRSCALPLEGRRHGVAAPTTNNEVTINAYHVAYRRADGRNTPGVDVPYRLRRRGRPARCRPAARSRSASSWCGRRQAGVAAGAAAARSPNIITTIADVTFYGRDRSATTSA